MIKQLMLAFCAMLAFASVTSAQMQAPLAGDDCCQKVCCDACCTPGSTIFFEVEATFFRYHRANGLRADELGPNPNDPDSFSNPPFEIAPRITLGRVDCNGFGTRIRYWDYDLTEVSNGGAGNDQLDVDTYTIDFEVFRRYQLDCDLSIELFVGARYNEFHEVIREDGTSIDQDVQFTGFGMTTGVEGRQCWRNGELYGFSRLAILADDQLVFDDADSNEIEVQPDSILGVIELGAGYEVCYPRANGGTWVFNAGVEYQLWMNYTSHRNNNGNPIGNSDVGFVGFVLGGGLVY